MSERPWGWTDEKPLLTIRRTRNYTHHEVLLTPRFTETDVPVPAEETPCAADPETWFPTPKRASTMEAKRVCSFCWMISECRDYGLAHPETDGVWGGLSQNERRNRSVKRTARR